MAETSKSSPLFEGPGKVKLEYFAIAGVAEKVRLALTCAKIPFDDIRINFAEWMGEDSRKKTAKYGQLPILTLKDGTEIYQSFAMMKYIGGNDPEGKLYPAGDIEKRLKIDIAMGVTADLTRAFYPAMVIGMRPASLGHPADMDSETKTAVIKSMRETFMEEEFPKYMNYYKDLLDENGGQFLSGDDLTIADLDALHTVRYYALGIADFIPTDSLEAYPEIESWIQRVLDYSSVKEYYANQAK
uniref:Glutathione transferase n=1 Tax=Ditylum brightwellii TaxID=49249 RepID=A0A7S4SC41_9STRA